MAQDKFHWVNLEDLREEGFFDMITKVGTEHLRLEIRLKDEDPLRLVDKRTDVPCGSYDRVGECPIDCP